MNWDDEIYHKFYKAVVRAHDSCDGQPWAFYSTVGDLVEHTKGYLQHEFVTAREHGLVRHEKRINGVLVCYQCEEGPDHPIHG